MKKKKDQLHLTYDAFADRLYNVYEQKFISDLARVLKRAPAET